MDLVEAAADDAGGEARVFGRPQEEFGRQRRAGQRQTGQQGHRGAGAAEVLGQEDQAGEQGIVGFAAPQGRRIEVSNAKATEKAGCSCRCQPGAERSAARTHETATGDEAGRRQAR